MEYYSALKRKEILTHAAAWMNHEDILSEISQAQKTNTIWSYSYVESKKVELVEPESRTVVARDGGVGEMGRCWSKGKTFSYKMNKFWEPNI